MALGSPVAPSSNHPATIHAPAPLLGQHSREILRELGRTNAETDTLIAGGTIEEHHPNTTEVSSR